jgi:pyruvate formate lyase activating enzyme
MIFGGLRKLSTLDYPTKLCATVFTKACNFRCPFCHNSSLAFGDGENISEEKFFSFLSKRKGLLDAVCISGGEPLLHDVTDFIKKIKDMGFLVKLDTNGSFPNKLSELIDAGLLDYVAMDVKAPIEKYGLVAGTDVFGEKIKKSIGLLMASSIPYEFRTTVVNELHCEEDFHKIGELIRGASAYYIQCFKDSGNILSDGLSAPTKEALEKYLQIAKQYVENTSLRGVD